MRTAFEMVELEDVVLQTTMSSGRTEKPPVLHQSMECMLHALLQGQDERLLAPKLDVGR